MNGTNKNALYTRFGANYNRQTKLVEFELFSKNGTVAILCIYDVAKGKDALFNIKMEKTGNVFKAYFDPREIFGPQGKDAKDEDFEGKVFYYGYRVFGPNFHYSQDWAPNSDVGFIEKVDALNNRFNPNKLAYDPYSRELSHFQTEISPDLDVSRSGSKLYFFDNGKLAPKSVFRFFTKEEEAFLELKPSCRALWDEIIGEVHLKSLTELQNFEEKGTYTGAAKFAQRVKELGVTMVEFLPLQEFDPNEGCGNYWGYMPLCYFAPVKRYAFDKKAGGAVLEFKKMVEEFHKKDIKVCLDVVYNHTGEARNYDGRADDVNLFSYALIDNREYYKSDSTGHYIGNSGCGNDANTAHEGFRRLVADSLEYWINLGVDAFRFDLAAALMDTDEGASVHYDRTKSLITELKEILENRGIKVNLPNEAGEGVNLIAEPWTCGGAEAYQLGNFPNFFAEWNDISRNTIRALSTRPFAVDFLAVKNLLKGTLQKFDFPAKSINYVSCHDGFTLWDLNSYDRKSPSTSGGSDWEICSSYGGNKVLRERGIKNQIALLTLSQGCFMIQIDDIILHSKGGNNNSYNLDNAVNYLDFENISDEKAPLVEFIKNLIQLRKKETLFKDENYGKNMKFFGLWGEEIFEEGNFWMNTACEFLGFSTFALGKTIYVAINKGDHELEFQLPEISKINPELKDEAGFYLVFDTKGNEFYFDGKLYQEKSFKISAHTIVLMFVK